MNNKLYMFRFLSNIQKSNLLTDFIKNIFNYNELHDYNYIFRMSNADDSIIIDIYDNISDNRFNRYIFDFNDEKAGVSIIREGNVFVTKIPIKNMSSDDNNKLYKLAYLFSLDSSLMIEYSKTFLDSNFVIILNEILK